MSFPKPPEVNIGMIGHVDHGKTTLTQRLTGKWTDEHSEELKRGISIRLGYADAAFYKCPTCDDPACYSTQKTCPNCKGKTELLRVVSFVDAPGHETLMATMLSGAAIMDGALLVIAANEVCPQPQTREHLMALEIIGAKRIIIVQNKIDLVSEEDAVKNYEQIVKFVKGTCAEKAPIIPVSAHHDINIDVLIKTMEEHIPTPKRDMEKPPLMYVARSFDVNKPGTKLSELKGGVVGGSLLQGTLKKGEKIEIAPGRKREVEGKQVLEPIFTTAHTLITGGTGTNMALPGGLIAIGTELDPTMVKSDSLAGKIVGRPGQLPPVLDSFDLSMCLLKRAVGTVVRPDWIRVKLKLPVCADQGQRIAVSRRIEGKWHLIGYGEIKSTKQ